MIPLFQTIGDLRRTITGNSSTISSLENQLTEAQNESQANVKRAEQSVAENNTLKESLSKQQQVIYLYLRERFGVNTLRK